MLKSTTSERIGVSVGVLRKCVCIILNTFRVSAGRKGFEGMLSTSIEGGGAFINLLCGLCAYIRVFSPLGREVFLSIHFLNKGHLTK